MKITIESYDRVTSVQIPDDSDIWQIKEAIDGALLAQGWTKRVIDKIFVNYYTNDDDTTKPETE